MKNKNTNMTRKNATSDLEEEKRTQNPENRDLIPGLDQDVVVDSVGPTLRCDYF